MVILKADEGKVYTNGETFGKEVCLPDNADLSAWRQVDEAERDNVATEADKDAALRRFGVEV